MKLFLLLLLPFTAIAQPHLRPVTNVTATVSLTLASPLITETNWLTEDGETARLTFRVLGEPAHKGSFLELKADRFQGSNGQYSLNFSLNPVRGKYLHKDAWTSVQLLTNSLSCVQMFVWFLRGDFELSQGSVNVSFNGEVVKQWTLPAQKPIGGNQFLSCVQLDGTTARAQSWWYDANGIPIERFLPWVTNTAKR